MKCVNRYGTEHEKVFSPNLLLMSPPRQRWICKLCGEEGIRQWSVCLNPDEYDTIKKEFDK